MMDDHEARRIEINGIVQGVGFRPFVYQLARRFNLNGEVANTSAGVVVKVEGSRDNLSLFAKELAENPPPLAHIIQVAIHETPPRGYPDFSISKSQGASVMSTLISPDVAICDDCLRELFDPNDRRYRYPFINCTNCGPRFTIISDIPYDRPKTSMHPFTMCPQCQAEYDDPLNRRFHAQPNACADCGPMVSLYDRKRCPVESADPIQDAIRLLREGRIIAVKGLGGFHLAVDAENDAAVKALRSRKHREEKPFALMSPSLASIRKYASYTSEEKRLLSSIQRPIVLLPKTEPNTISEAVSPRNRYFGVMLPYTPLHHLLLKNDQFTALVMTSGNLSEEPIAIDNQEAFQRLSGIAEYFLMHDRDIYLRSDDSIVRRVAGNQRIVRRSRGFVPIPIFLKRDLEPVLACGAELKNTICLTKGNQAFLSQHIGDLENTATNEFFEKTIRHMQRILDIAPQVIAYDMHPDYLSSRWAMEQENVRKIAVQHHHAHVVSAMAENRLTGRVIGLSFDGTGYGPDGHVWGGEVLMADERNFERAAHIAYVAMPGSALAVKQPWRMGVSHLYAAFGKDMERLSLPFLDRVDSSHLTVMTEMIAKKVNAPMTSSVGRLFDAVAAIAGLRNEVAFEGQAAMELEMVADTSAEAVYDFDWNRGNPLIINPAPIIRGVVDDLLRGVAPPVISGRFHATLVGLFSDLCDHLRRESGLKRVVLSGGVFQNAILLQGLVQALERRGFDVFSHSLVPTNDGGISLGQAVIAAASLETASGALGAPV